MAKIKKVKKSMKLTIPCHPTVEGLTDSFIAWYKDHGMTTSLRKALEANRWTEKMIQEFKWTYIRKYKILQDYAVRYPDEKLSNEDELEGGGLADLVGPQRETCPKDSERGAEGSMSERATKKKGARKTSLPNLPGGEEKKAVKHKRGQGNEPEPMTLEPPTEKKQKGERKKKKKRKAEADADEPISKKKKAKGTPSAALRRAPDAESLPVPPGAAPMAIEWRTSLDEQLEAHLLGTEPPATVAQQSQTAASSMAPQGPDMGGFLAGLRKSIPWAETQQAMVTTPVPRWSKQTWIPVPVAEARTTRPPTVRELLARQAAKEIPRGSLLEVPQPTALRSPPGREVSTMETGGQEPTAMDAEVQKEPKVPSSRTARDEPMIPTDLECQVRAMEVTVAQEMVTTVKEEEEPMGLPSIETRTIETQGGNYATIDTRILDQLGRLEVVDQGLTKLVQGATQPKPALGPAEIPGMMEVELVQMAQATTSQAASSMESQGTAGSKLSSDQKTQEGGHGKGKLIGKQPAKRGRKGMPKKKTVTPAITLVKRTDQPRQGGNSTRDHV